MSAIQDNIRTVDSLLTNLVQVGYPRITEDVNTKCAIWESRLLSTREKLVDVFKMPDRNRLVSRGISPVRVDLYRLQIRPIGCV